MGAFRPLSCPLRSNVAVVRNVDPVRLVFGAPSIDGDEDWRDRSMLSWVTLAGHEGVDATRTSAGASGDPETWCGNVEIDGIVYQVHRGLARAIRMTAIDDPRHSRPLLHASTWVEVDILADVEILDGRNDLWGPAPLG